MEIISRDGKITIRTQYDPAVIEKIKSLPKRKWNKHARVWELPAQYLQLVRQTFPDAHFRIFDSSPQYVRVEVYPSHAEVFSTQQHVYEIVEKTSTFSVPSADFSDKYRLGEWDGTICLYNKKTNKLPIGLLEKVKSALETRRYRVTITDHRKLPIATPKKASITLRNYQREALKSWVEKDRWGIIAISPGLGKTEIAIQAIADLGVRTLFLVHSQDLAMQAVERLSRALGIEIGFIGSGEFNLKKINVGMVQTFYQNLKNPQFTKILEETELLIADEAHHYSARSFSAVMQRCGARYRLGLTATPYREEGDELVFIGQLGDVVYRMSLHDGVEQGWLCKPYFKFLDVKDTADTGLDNYQDDYKINIVDNRERNSIITAQAIEYLQDGKSILILVNRIQHGEILQKMIDGSVFLNGGMPKKKRKEMLDRFKAGEIKCVIATSIFDEGVDAPQIDVLINAVAQKSRGKYIQRIGRAMRINRGKEYCRIIDFIDGGIHTRRHSQMRKDTIRNEGFMVTIT